MTISTYHRRVRLPAPPDTQHRAPNYPAISKEWLVTWNPFPPAALNLTGPQLSVISAKQAIETNLRQLKTRVQNGKDPTRIWLVIAVCDSEQEAEKIRRFIDLMHQQYRKEVSDDRPE